MSRIGRGRLLVCVWFGFAAMLCIPDATACRIPVHSNRDPEDGIDLTRQREQVRELASTADDILVVRVIDPGTSRDEVNESGMTTDRIETLKVLKGAPPASPFVHYSSDITVGCGWVPRSFDEPVVIPGREHLLYLKDGKVLRFVAKRRGRGELPMWAEIGVIKEALRAK